MGFWQLFVHGLVAAIQDATDENGLPTVQVLSKVLQRLETGAALVGKDPPWVLAFYARMREALEERIRANTEEGAT